VAVVTTHANAVEDVSEKDIQQLCTHVCMRVCQYFETKTTEHIITKLGWWIVHDKSWSPISFEVKRLNVKVTWSNKCNVETTA